MAKRKLNARTFAQQKRKRRQWLTFVRMCRYGVNNFSRNAWLTIAATAVMTITLLIIFMTFVAHNVLSDSVDAISRKVDMSIYLKGDTSNNDAEKIANQLRKLPNVEKVSYVSAEQARTNFAESNRSDPDALSALNDATNKFFASLRVNLKNINNTTELDAFVKNNKDLKEHIDPKHAPSFAGSRRDAIKNLARATDFAQKLGLVLTVLFVAISSLIVFNTIRMAIFNRKDEIQMMKLIGADKNFIRGPFVVEAIVYGFIAAVAATGLGMLILYLSRVKLESYGVAVMATFDLLTTLIGFVLLIMIALGAIIGTVSSLLATRRYLKI